MDPNGNGYLAWHLQSQFYFNYYNSACFPQYRYSYGPNQYFIPHLPNSISSPSVYTLQSASVVEARAEQMKQLIPKKKRVTKRPVFVDIQNKISKTSKIYKNLKKSLNYFDPCRAPPITTLRNSFELQSDLQQQLRKQSLLNDHNIPSPSQSERILEKLQILIKVPDDHKYPFLICKKRKYYRNLKRRYSVSYFQQRAYYILNKVAIPLNLEPKNNCRKNRLKVQSHKNDMDAQSSPSSNSASCMSSESQDLFKKCQKVGIENNWKGSNKAPSFKKETIEPSQINYA